MADVGRSTDSHLLDGSDIQRALVNWGNWQQCLPYPIQDSIPTNPVFREYVAGYRDSITSNSQKREAPEDVEAAEELDALIANMDQRDQYVLVIYYVLGQSSRIGCRTLQFLDDESGTRYSCSHQTFANWLRDAENRLEQKSLDILTALQ